MLTSVDNKTVLQNTRSKNVTTLGVAMNTSFVNPATSIENKSKWFCSLDKTKVFNTDDTQSCSNAKNMYTKPIQVKDTKTTNCDNHDILISDRNVMVQDARFKN